MRTICENCRAVYESRDDSEVAVCPRCEHVNRPPAGTDKAHPETTAPINAEHDPLKTIVFGVPGPATPGLPEGGPKNPVAAGTMELIVVGEGGPPQAHAITRARTTIGRGLCDVQIQDPEVSREHCSIEILDGLPVLRDLQSANGTLVNGQVIREHALEDGDEIQVGSTRLRFRIAKSG